ncbi:MAG: beta-lactamase family protein [bacterium]|nr:beta-lactamase family protein [bacterium]
MFKNYKLMKNKLLSIILVVIIATSSLNAQNSISSFYENKDEILKLLEEYNVPAVGIGIIKEGKIQKCNVYGELRKDVPAKDNAIFTVASITKPVVTMLTLKLVESKKWNLDEPLYKYWIDPDIKDDSRHKMITTRHILSHKSGFSNWRSDFETNKLGFINTPGTKYGYSGEGFEYLRKALEKKFNKSLYELSKDILFKPLKMKDSKYNWEKGPDKSKFAYRHNEEGKEYKDQGGTHASAAGGLLTTIEDYLKFGIDVMNRKGLSKDLYNDMIRKQCNLKKNLDQGLGWQIMRDLPNGEYALFHEGGEWGVATVVILFPVSKRGLVVFTNGEQGYEVCSRLIEEFPGVGEEIVKILNSMSYDPDQIEIVNVQKDILSTYTGSYFMESFQMTIDIIYEDNTLKFKSPYSSMVMYAESENKFFLRDDDLRVEFVKSNNELTGINVIYKGGKPEFSKKTK